MTARAAAVGTLVALLLAGCIPIPMPPAYVTPRQHLDEQVPAFITEGRTTRAEVLLTLGHPDQFAGETEFTYLVLRNSIGMLMIAMGQQYTLWRTHYRALVVTFDTHGVVAAARVHAGECAAGATAGTTACGPVTLPRRE